MISATLRRWRSPGPRWRAGLGLLASASLLAGAWLAYALRADRWPARVELPAAEVTSPLAFSPDGGSFATSTGGEITLWDTSTGLRRATWKVPTDRFAQAGAFSPDGRTFAAAMSRYPRPMEVELIDVATGRTSSTLTARLTNVFGLRFAADGKAVVLLSADRGGLKEVVTWEVSTGSPTSTRPVPLLKSPGCYLAASVDGRFLVSTQRPGGTVWFSDLAVDDAKGVTIGPMSAAEVSSAAFSADGRGLAIGRRDGSLEVWDVPSRRPIRSMKGHRGGYASVGLEFAPDGRTIASRGEPQRGPGLSQLLRDIDRGLFGGGDRPSTEVIVVDVATGERVARSGTSIHPIYSPDGRTVATREFDGSVRLRDVPDPGQSGRSPGPTPARFSGRSAGIE